MSQVKFIVLTDLSIPQVKLALLYESLRLIIECCVGVEEVARSL
jgi:hypothetical protein